MFPATLKEAVTHHALAKQNEHDQQNDYKHELSNSERGWLSSGRGRRIHFTFLLETYESRADVPVYKTATRTSVSPTKTERCGGESSLQLQFVIGPKNVSK